MMLPPDADINCYLHKVDSLHSKRFSIDFSKLSVQILVLSQNFFSRNQHNYPT